ncbi:DNA polymerase subunit beta [Domibacillus antri]|uniref:DNA polymerase subunit beta n=1 Tax=Domibacillus antri TaxID=1714264 RepID=A0A1Q8Q4C7_9BACI|nr:nucleotidyltransferase domain-containing protein [Domibacillus antri]OLN22131.1 DNA polymerase subunit beta [Domibacillus antri]
MQTELFQTIQNFLVKKINPSFIIVFGSYAKGATHKESDIDVAFYSKDQSPAAYEVFMLAQELADILHIQVDLVNLREASTVFQAQIFSTGTVIYCTDETLRMSVQMTALSMYTKLNEDRMPILNNIDESGSIYEK